VVPFASAYTFMHPFTHLRGSVYAFTGLALILRVCLIEAKACLHAFRNYFMGPNRFMGSSVDVKRIDRTNKVDRETL
jgi:hypothetical protein